MMIPFYENYLNKMDTKIRKEKKKYYTGTIKELGIFQLYFIKVKRMSQLKTYSLAL